LQWSQKPEGGLIIKLEDKSIIKSMWGWALRVILNPESASQK
jgi:hypothetical protein